MNEYNQLTLEFNGFHRTAVNGAWDVVTEPSEHHLLYGNNLESNVSANTNLFGPCKDIYEVKSSQVNLTFF